MKHLFGLCLLFITINSAAQGITYSTYEKFDPRSGDYSVVGRSGGRLYTYRSGSDGHFLDAWNDSMNRVATVILDFFPEKIYDTRFIAYPDKIIALFQTSDHGRITQYVAMLDGAGRLQGKARQLDESKTGIFGASGNYFYSVVSEDKRFISVYSTSAKADEMRVHSLLLDDNLKIIKRIEKTYQGKGALSALPALLDNEGNFYLPVTTNAGNRDYASGIWILSIPGNVITATECPLGGNYGAGLYFKIDNNTRRIYCAGFYSEKKAGDYEGLMLAQVRTDSANAVNVLRIPIEDRLRLATGERNKNKAFNDYKTRQLIIRNDGGFVLVAEDYYLSVRTGGGVAPYGYYNSYYSPYAGAQNIREYHFGDVLACSYNAEGVREWSTFIRKDQYSQEDGGIFSSYSFINTGGSLGFLYNNFDARRSRIMLAVIDAAGNIDTQALDAGGQEDPDWLPLAGRQISAHELVVPCLSRKQICFAKVVF